MNIADESKNQGNLRAKFAIFRNDDAGDRNTCLLSPNVPPQDSLESRTSEDFSDAELPNLQSISQAEILNTSVGEFSRSYEKFVCVLFSPKRLHNMSDLNTRKNTLIFFKTCVAILRKAYRDFGLV